jgi:hypothetical protein
MKSLEIPMPKCEDNIKIDLKGIRCEYMAWGYIGRGWNPEASRGGQGSKPSDSSKDWEFLDQLRDYQLLKMDSSPWSYSRSTQLIQCR